MQSEEVIKAILSLQALSSLESGLRRSVAELLVRISKPRSIERGQVWLKRGEPSENKGYILLKGSADIEKPTSPVTTCHAPELIGEAMQFNPKHVRTATVSAVEDCIALRFLWDDFWKAVEESLGEEDRQRVRTAIENHAWAHFAE